MSWDQYSNTIIEYQKLNNLFHNTLNHSSKFRARSWIEINDDTHVRCSANSQIKFKTTMIKSSLCEYWCIYIPERNYNRYRLLCSSFCLTKLYRCVVISMYSLIEYSENYSKTFKYKNSTISIHNFKFQSFINTR